MRQSALDRYAECVDKIMQARATVASRPETVWDDPAVRKQYANEIAGAGIRAGVAEGFLTANHGHVPEELQSFGPNIAAATQSPDDAAAAARAARSLVMYQTYRSTTSTGVSGFLAAVGNMHAAGNLDKQIEETSAALLDTHRSDTEVQAQMLQLYFTGYQAGLARQVAVAEATGGNIPFVSVEKGEVPKVTVHAGNPMASIERRVREG